MFVVYYETILSELKIKPSTRFFLLFIMNRERELKIRLMNEGRWMINLLTFFRTTHKVKVRQVVKNRGQYCGDIELTGYLANAAGPVSLVLDLHIDHDLFGSSSDPNLNGKLHWRNDIDKSLNEANVDKIRKYRTDSNTNPPTTISFMTTIVSTTGRIHSEFIRILF